LRLTADHTRWQHTWGVEGQGGTQIGFCLPKRERKKQLGITRRSGRTLLTHSTQHNPS